MGGWVKVEWVLSKFCNLYLLADDGRCWYRGVVQVKWAWGVERVTVTIPAIIKTNYSQPDCGKDGEKATMKARWAALHIHWHFWGLVGVTSKPTGLLRVAIATHCLRDCCYIYHAGYQPACTNSLQYNYISFKWVFYQLDEFTCTEQIVLHSLMLISFSFQLFNHLTILHFHMSERIKTAPFKIKILLLFIRSFARIWGLCMSARPTTTLS